MTLAVRGSTEVGRYSPWVPEHQPVDSAQSRPAGPPKIPPIVVLTADNDLALFRSSKAPAPAPFEQLNACLHALKRGLDWDERLQRTEAERVYIHLQKQVRDIPDQGSWEVFPPAAGWMQEVALTALGSACVDARHTPAMRLQMAYVANNLWATLAS